MSLFHLIGLAIAAACFIIGSVAWRAGYSAGHKAGLKESTPATTRYWAKAQPDDNVIDLEIPRPGVR